MDQQTPTPQEQLSALRNRVTNVSSLHIGEVSKQLKADFIALADERFGNDFGHTLQWLWDEIAHLQEIVRLQDIILSMESRLQALEQGKIPEPPTAQRGPRLLNGRTVQVKNT